MNSMTFTKIITRATQAVFLPAPSRSRRGLSYYFWSRRAAAIFVIAFSAFDAMQSVAGLAMTAAGTRRTTSTSTRTGVRAEEVRNVAGHDEKVAEDDDAEALPVVFLSSPVPSAPDLFFSSTRGKRKTRRSSMSSFSQEQAEQAKSEEVVVPAHGGQENLDMDVVNATGSSLFELRVQSEDYQHGGPAGAGPAGAAQLAQQQELLQQEQRTWPFALSIIAGPKEVAHRLFKSKARLLLVSATARQREFEGPNNPAGLYVYFNDTLASPKEWEELTVGALKAFLPTEQLGPGYQVCALGCHRELQEKMEERKQGENAPARADWKMENGKIVLHRSGSLPVSRIVRKHIAAEDLRLSTAGFDCHIGHGIDWADVSMSLPHTVAGRTMNYLAKCAEDLQVSKIIEYGRLASASFSSISHPRKISVLYVVPAEDPHGGGGSSGDRSLISSSSYIDENNGDQHPNTARSFFEGQTRLEVVSAMEQPDQRLRVYFNDTLASPKDWQELTVGALKAFLPGYLTGVVGYQVCARGCHPRLQSQVEERHANPATLEKKNALEDKELDRRGFDCRPSVRLGNALVTEVGEMAKCSEDLQVSKIIEASLMLASKAQLHGTSRASSATSGKKEIMPAERLYVVPRQAGLEHLLPEVATTSALLGKPAPETPPPKTARDLVGSQVAQKWQRFLQEEWVKQWVPTRSEWEEGDDEVEREEQLVQTWSGENFCDTGDGRPSWTVEGIYTTYDSSRVGGAEDKYAPLPPLQALLCHALYPPRVSGRRQRPDKNFAEVQGTSGTSPFPGQTHGTAFPNLLFLDGADMLYDGNDQDITKASNSHRKVRDAASPNMKPHLFEFVARNLERAKDQSRRFKFWRQHDPTDLHTERPLLQDAEGEQTVGEQMWAIRARAGEYMHRVRFAPVAPVATEEVTWKLVRYRNSSTAVVNDPEFLSSTPPLPPQQNYTSRGRPSGAAGHDSSTSVVSSLVVTYTRGHRLHVVKGDARKKQYGRANATLYISLALEFLLLPEDTARRERSSALSTTSTPTDNLDASLSSTTGGPSSGEVVRAPLPLENSRLWLDRVWLERRFADVERDRTTEALF
ncbi:unnamed protein product [Amoebophrya sp. A120]|nr:unnamed protein product [Amoebophrya sp. A120]|eukprot:GSA120T00008699001.1